MSERDPDPEDDAPDSPDGEDRTPGDGVEPDGSRSGSDGESGTDRESETDGESEAEEESQRDEASEGDEASATEWQTGADWESETDEDANADEASSSEQASTDEASATQAAGQGPDAPADEDSADRSGDARPGVGALEEEGWAPDRDEGAEAGPDPAPDVGEMAAELRELREELDSFETDVDHRTVHRDEIESELRRYVRWKLRRGHARGWGPYLVLLYGTAMTLGAFFYLQGLWSILAMLVVWTSTIGVYVLMVLAGAGFNLLGLPMWALDKVGRWRGN